MFFALCVPAPSDLQIKYWQHASVCVAVLHDSEPRPLLFSKKKLPLPLCHPGPDYQVQVLLGTAPYTTHVQTCSDDPSRSKQTLTKTVKRGEKTMGNPFIYFY